jgi:hypothetical protein
MAKVFTLFLLCTSFAIAQTPEAAVLGAACEIEKPDDVVQIRAWHAKVSEALRLERAGDVGQAAEVAKQVVRGRCTNEHWWLKLAELQTLSGQEANAVATLGALYGRRSNAVDWRLRDPSSPLHRLPPTRAYQQSDLAASLAKDRNELAQRREEARSLLNTLPREARPTYWIAKDACPGECCAYGSWSALQEVILYDSPEGFSEVARIPQGQRVQALTGEVRLRPIPVRVRYGALEQITLPEGSLVFLLDYLGEGHGRISSEGKLFEEDILAVHEHCAFPSRDCWGEVLDPRDDGKQRDGDWWVKIQTADGLIGWTREAGKFSM